ncbi:MAG: hypothetical protein J5J06_16520 [Phycisphaerae bacterium]|nr:hypothetical protein [Phycisphaerae bacterium]
MKVEQPTQLRRQTPEEPATLIGEGSPKHPISPLAAEALSLLPRRSDCAVARCPVTIDIFGGAADFAGSLVLLTPLADHACVAGECHDGGTLTVRSAARNGGERLSIDLRMESLFPGGAVVDAVRGRALVGEHADAVLTAMIGAVVEGVRSGIVAPVPGGLILGAAESDRGGPCGGRLAAVAGATILAMSRIQGGVGSREEIAAACHRVVTDWLAFPIGSSSAGAVLCGKSGSVVALRGEPCKPVDTIPLPDGLSVVGVQGGAFDSDWSARCMQVRAASVMGRVLIDRIVTHEDGEPLGSNGALSRVSVGDYVARFRDRLPTKLRGRDYLDKFGPLDDVLAVIAENTVYKVRSRTEHHIYEHARAVEFAEGMRSPRDGDRGLWTKKLAELCAASHWSYGQRCALGSVETDLLVRLLRESRLRQVVHGAKVSGQGCGGLVCVLMKDDADSKEAARSVLGAYEERSGRRARWIPAAPAGSAAVGAELIRS